MNRCSALPVVIWDHGGVFKSKATERLFTSPAHVLINVSDSAGTLICTCSDVWEDEVPVRGWGDCPPVCSIYWGSRTEGPPTESSTAFQPALSPASVSCKRRKPGGEINKNTSTKNRGTIKWIGFVRWCFYHRVVNSEAWISTFCTMKSFTFLQILQRRGGLLTQGFYYEGMGFKTTWICKSTLNKE